MVNTESSMKVTLDKEEGKFFWDKQDNLNGTEGVVCMYT